MKSIASPAMMTIIDATVMATCRVTSLVPESVAPKSVGVGGGEGGGGAVARDVVVVEVAEEFIA
jgi:hypothetical protein